MGIAVLMYLAVVRLKKEEEKQKNNPIYNSDIFSFLLFYR